MPSKPPIFVVGTGRSGTTLLRQMLSSHPAIHLTHEASFYLWERGARPERLFQDYVRGINFRYLGLDTRRFLSALPARCSNREFFETLMRRAAQQHGKVRFGDKTPGHAGCLDRIFADFPDARVVRIVRSPVRVAESLLRMPWFPPSLLLAILLIRREERAIGPFDHRIHTVRLEDLLADPEGRMREVLRFVDEPWDPAVLAHAQHAPDDLPPLPWFQRAKTKVAADARRPLSPSGEQLVRVLCRRVCERHGYAGSNAPVSVLATLGAGLRRVLPLLDGLGKLRQLHRAFRRGEAEPRIRRLLFGLNPEALPGWTPPETPPLPPRWEQLLPAPLPLGTEGGVVPAARLAAGGAQG